jgi:hypothetical protein
VLSQLFGALSVKYQPKGWKKCKNAKKIKKCDANAECDAKCNEL